MEDVVLVSLVSLLFASFFLWVWHGDLTYHLLFLGGDGGVVRVRWVGYGIGIGIHGHGSP